MNEENTGSEGSVKKRAKRHLTLGHKEYALVLSWPQAIKMRYFRFLFIPGMLVLAGILIAFPTFFNAIQERNGFVFRDFVLEWLPPHNVSIAVFFLIWSCCILLVIRIWKNPLMFLETLWAYNLVTLVRMSCIGLISLNPPAGLIPLADPITNQFYGEHYITHDLFFSGHTTTVFLIFLCLRKKWDRIYAFSASVLLGFLLLVQHVHYTIDVLAAPFFTYAVYRFTLLFIHEEKFIVNTKNGSS